MNRKQMVVCMRFISHSFNELCADGYGQLVDIDSTDKVFEDIFGVRKIASRLYSAVSAMECARIIDEAGMEKLVEIFDHDSYRDAVMDLVRTRSRLERLRKEAKRLYKKINGGDGTRKHRQQDLMAYKSKCKEIKYGSSIYEDAIKQLRKYLGLKTGKKGFSKEPYSFLKNFANANRSTSSFIDGGGFFNMDGGDWDGFDSLYDLATGSTSRFTGIGPDNDDGGNLEKFISAQRRRGKKGMPLDYLDDDDLDDDYDNEDEGDEPDPIADLNKKYDLLAQNLSKILPGATAGNGRLPGADLFNRMIDSLDKITKKISVLEKNDEDIAACLLALADDGDEEPDGEISDPLYPPTIGTVLMSPEEIADMVDKGAMGSASSGPDAESIDPNASQIPDSSWGAPQRGGNGVINKDQNTAWMDQQKRERAARDEARAIVVQQVQAEMAEEAAANAANPSQEVNAAPVPAVPGLATGNVTP